jgi:hypothetical protein
MFSPTRVRSRPLATWAERSTKKDCYYVVRFRARFSDKMTKIIKVFLLRERWLDEGCQTRPWKRSAEPACRRWVDRSFLKA